MAEAVFEVDPENLKRELGSMTFSRVITDNPMLLVRAAHIYNLLDGLGLGLPFFLVHDLFLLLTQSIRKEIILKGRDQSLRLAVNRGVFQLAPEFDDLLNQYQSLLTDLARSELCQKGGEGQIADELLAAVIAKIVDPVQAHLTRRGAHRRLPLTLHTYENLEPVQYLTSEGANEARSIFELIANARIRIRISLEQIDLDTMKLLEMFKSDQSVGDATELLDIYRSLDLPEVHDIANFSLDLIPSVLETKKSSGVQTFSIDGYASIETRGSLDGILPSELAYDDDLFDRRFADGDLFYYGREKQNTQRERLHYILIDASASMRGLRTVFARGLALALAKKMTLRGETVWLRFFDSRLYERQELKSNRMKIPYILCFRSEYGRNPNRAFGELEKELSRLCREQSKDILLTMITHARCHLEPRLVEDISAKATVCGIFVMPSGGEVELEYKNRLNQSYVINADVLADKSKRQSEALRILSKQ